MEDRLGSESVLHPSSSANLRSDSKLTGEKRNNTESAGKSESNRKRLKMRDLKSVFRSEANETLCSVSSLSKEAMGQFHFSNKEDMSQITKEHVTMKSCASQAARPERTSLSLLGDIACLSLGYVNSASNPMNLNTQACTTNNSTNDTVPASIDDNGKTSLLADHDKGSNINFKISRGIELDLNADVSHSVDQDPFYPYKIYGHAKSRETSECGSSTGPLEENNSLKAWKEMKQNGFLSSSHGGIPMPKQRGRKSKNDTIKKKMELAKREQVNRFTKIAAPSGLLNELNPGIINHVRNSKQVHSIIEALVRSEKLENNHIERRAASQLKRGTGEINDRRNGPENMHDSGTNNLGLSLEDEPLNTLSESRQTKGCSMTSNAPIIPLSSVHNGGAQDSDIAERRVCGEFSGASHFTSGHKDDTLMLKFLSTITMATENTNSMFNEESVSHSSIPSLSVKAATVASQWLELLNLDIRGRLAALQRSRKRVRAVIQTELPFLMSKDFSSSQENDPFASQSSTAGCPTTATPGMHRARWTALFDQMEQTLSEEGRHLEIWLNQVKEMQLHCERGLQCVNWTAAYGLPPENDSRLKKEENSEELAIRAAAASIYSTCNLVMSTENVSCF